MLKLPCRCRRNSPVSGNASVRTHHVMVQPTTKAMSWFSLKTKSFQMINEFAGNVKFCPRSELCKVNFERLKIVTIINDKSVIDDNRKSYMCTNTPPSWNWSIV